MTRFGQITFLHGKDELPSGFVERLEAALRTAQSAVKYARPFIPSNLDTDEAHHFVVRNYVSRMEANSLLVGVGRGGLIASAVQSNFPALRLSAFAVNSPTEEDGIVAEPCASAYSRVALYSSAYAPIKERCGWKDITPMAYDVPWLASGCKTLFPLAYLISAYGRGADMDKEVAMMFPA